MLKLVFCVRKRQDLSHEEFYRYWLNKHGPLVISHSAALNIKRYVQSHTRHYDLGQMITAQRGMKLAGFDGVAEAWWNSHDDLLAALGSDEGQSASDALAEDEARFIDMESSTIFFTEEHVIVES